MQKKILFYSDCFIFGGSENVLVNLLNSSKIQNRYEIFFAYRYTKEYDYNVKEKIDKNVTIIPIKLLANNSLLYRLKLNGINFIIFFLIKSILKFIELTGLYWLYALIKIIILLKKYRPDILFINNGGYPGAFSCRTAVISAKILGIKSVIMNINNLALKPSYLQKIIDKVIEKKVFRFITASVAAGKRLEKNRNFKHDKIISIPNTINFSSYDVINNNILKNEININRKCVIIGSVGLLTKRKGHKYLIDAIHILINELNIKNFKVVIFGNGEEINNLENKIKTLGLKNYCSIVGFRKNIQNYMKDFDIFVLPSINNEDFPYVNLEVMSLGIPIVSTNVAGIPEQVINGTNGYVVEPKNPEQLAFKLSILIKDEKKRKLMGINGRKLFEKKYNYEKIINKYINLFDSINR